MSKSEVSAAKHTPGPWRIQWGRQEHYPLSIHNGAVNVVTSVGRKASPEATANAHLIAAAPELLAQAQCVVAACDADDVAALVREVNVLRAAIAKAIGSAQ